MRKIATAMTLAALVTGLGLRAQAETLYDWTTSGSIKVGQEKTVTMPEDGEVYLKLSGMKAGSSYTFVANGTGAAVEVVFTYAWEGDVTDESLAMSEADLKTDDQERCIVTKDEWIDAYIVQDPDYEYDPGEWKESKVTPKGYFLHLMGDPGASITVKSYTGVIEEQIQLGDIDNPKVISPTTVPSTFNPAVVKGTAFVEGTYYFEVSSAKLGKYLFTTTGGTEELPVTLKFLQDTSSSAAYELTDVSETVAADGNSAYLLTVTKTGVLTFYAAGEGEKFGLVHQYAAAGTLGRLTVTTKGAAGKWSVKGASGTYESGETIGILGQQTVVFSKVTGFSTPENQTALPTDTKPEVELVGVYNDTNDPKDDTVAGAVKISPASKVATAARTLFKEDEFDHFAFSAKDGVYYNFKLADLVGDATMTIFRKGDATETALAGPATEIAQFTAGKGDFIIRVSHAGETAADSQYALEYSSANVGAISFSKSAVKVAKSAGTVTLTVNRSASDGKVRVRYGTVNGTAKPGIDYVAQNGELVWEAGDKKAKTIVIKLIPELFAEEAISRQFQVQLKPIEEELEEDEYPAAITAGKDVTVVTVTEAKGKASAVVKPATVKTETVPLETGTYQGVIAEDGNALTNGFPALASVTFTAKDATKKALSAKVVLGGKTYAFAADGWSEESDDTTAVALMTLKQTINKVAYESTLRIAVARGATADPGDWLEAAATVELTMNVPDANNKGVQEGIIYTGELFRDNAKVQDYLYAVTNAVGYYTVALSPSGVFSTDGIPSGNGYLTLTIDNKGKAKVAGMLADGTTKPSYSSIVAVRDDGDTLLVPVFVAKSPYCFGGTLKFYRGEDGKYVVDSTVQLRWNNDNAALTYDGEEGWRIDIDPVGGYFNTVNNLQAYYLTYALDVDAAEVDELPEEVLADGYEFVTSVQPNETPVSLVGNTLSTEKRQPSKFSDIAALESGVNPCNVQVKLTRATGIVTGSFAVWTANEDGKLKEITGIKHNGILLLSRDEAAPFDNDVLSAGFFTQAATISYEDAKGKKKTRKYTASLPFNILAKDQGEPDWYADDWGERSED